MNNQEKNNYVKAQLLHALMKEMNETPLEKISVSALVQSAQVGRASFYRNYTDIKDILLQEADRLTKAWGKEFDETPHKEPNELLITLLDFYKQHQDFFLAVYAAGQDQIILDTILKQINISPETPNALAYVQSSFAYMLYGWIHEWMKRGMQESGTELAQMFTEAQKKPGV